MTLLAIQNLGIKLGKRRIIRQLDLQLAIGEMVGLIGPNGAGKTTLIKTIARLLPIQQGTISFQNQPINEIDDQLLARQLAYLPQSGQAHWAINVQQLVMLGRLAHRSTWRAPAKADQTAVQKALHACDVAQFSQRPVTELSGGERARVLLARALAGEPKLLLADEPVAGLDPGHQLDVMEKLRELAEGGAGVIVVMHDLTLAARYCHRLVLLHEQKIMADGNAAEVLAPEYLARCYGIQAYHGQSHGQPIIVPLTRLA